MKKLIILVSLIALLAGGMAFGQVTVSGQIEYGVLSDFSNAPGQHWDNILAFNAKIDEFNTGLIRIRARQSLSANGGIPIQTANYAGVMASDAPLIDRFLVTTNVLPAIGVKDAPFKWTSVNGVNWFQTLETTKGVSPYAVSRVSRIAAGNSLLGTHNRFAFGDALTLGFAILPSDWSGDAISPNNKGGFFFEANSTQKVGDGTLDIEVNYGTFGRDVDKRVALGTAELTGGVRYLTKMNDINLGLAANFLKEMDSDEAVGYKYGAAVSFGLPAFTVKAGLMGQEESELRLAEAQLLLPLNKVFTVEVGATMGLDSDVYDDFLNEIDANLQIKAGKNLIRVGYLMVSDKNGAGSLINDELSRIGRKTSYVEKGGAYFEVSIPF